MQKLKKFLIYMISQEYRKMYKRKREFLNYYKNSDNVEIKKMIEHIIRTDSFDMMNCQLSKDYENEVTVIAKQGELFYAVKKDGRKIYIAEDSEKRARDVYISLLREQDENSPHCYLNREQMNRLFENSKRCERIRVFELGAQEGMFSLELAEIADEIHLFECEKKWITALRETFIDYTDKTMIINKYVSNKNDDNMITLDEYYNSHSQKKIKGLTIIKMDIEGAELNALEGMREIIQKAENILILVCTYHRKNDEEKIREQFKRGYNIVTSPGYFCFFVADDYEKPYIRRCVLKIEKEDQDMKICSS